MSNPIIRSDGYTVRVIFAKNDKRNQGFPFLAKSNPGSKAWLAAMDYAFTLGAKKVIVERPANYKGD